MPNLIAKLMIAALLAGTSSTATAQPGDGIRLGGSEGRLHPYVELEGRYDSNAYWTTEAVSDYIIHVRPGLTLTVPGEMTSVDAGASLDFAEYLGATDPATKDLSNLSARANLGITVNPKGTVGFEFNEDFDRSDRPRSLSFGTALVSNYNVLDVKVPWRPGGGALTLDAHGAWFMETYEAPVTAGCPSPDPACSAADLGYNEYRAGAGVNWKFLPRTSGLLEATYYQRKPKDAVVSATGDTDGWRALAGLTGLVTPHLAATVKAGYGSAASSNAAFGTLGTFLANVEGNWIPSETANVKLGYARDVRVDPGVLYTDDRISIEARQLMAGRFELGLIGSWELLSYSPGSDTSTIVTVTPSVGAEITRWLKAELAYAYTDRNSDSYGRGSYTKNEVWLKAVATY
jgi:hypothetical protein